MMSYANLEKVDYELLNTLVEALSIHMGLQSTLQILRIVDEILESQYA